MKKLSRKILVSMALAAGISTPAFAANLDNHIGDIFTGVCTFHFVNNQIGGQTGPLDLYFSNIQVLDFAPTKTTASTLHYTLTLTTLNSELLASTNTNPVPGKLVLSDFSCDGGKKECDPKTEVCDVPK